MKRATKTAQVFGIIALLLVSAACARKRDFEGGAAQAEIPVNVPSFSVAFANEPKRSSTSTFRDEQPKQVLACFKGDFLVNQTGGLIQYLGHPAKNNVLLRAVGDCSRKVRLLRYDAGHNLIDDVARELNPGEESLVSIQLETGDLIELVYEEAVVCRLDSEERAEQKNYDQSSSYAQISFGECMP